MNLATMHLWALSMPPVWAHNNDPGHNVFAGPRIAPERVHNDKDPDGKEHIRVAPGRLSRQCGHPYRLE